MTIENEQVRYEVNAWLRMLDFQQQESAYMKTRIAEVAKEKSESEVLKMLEYYQNMFVNKEAVIALLRRDILSISEKRNDRTRNALEALHLDMHRMEQEFSSLRDSFNDYVHSVAFNL